MQPRAAILSLFAAASAGAAWTAQNTSSVPGRKPITPQAIGNLSAIASDRAAGLAQAEASATCSCPWRSDLPMAACAAVRVGRSRNVRPSMSTRLSRHHSGTMPSFSCGLRGSPVLHTLGFPRKIGSQQSRTFPSSPAPPKAQTSLSSSCTPVTLIRTANPATPLIGTASRVTNSPGNAASASRQVIRPHRYRDSTAEYSWNHFPLPPRTTAAEKPPNP